MIPSSTRLSSDTMAVAPALPKDLDSTTVLVIDDDDGVRRICVEMLQARGLRALGAPSVGEGLRAFDERRPTAVLLDLRLPDGAGIDVLRELQRRSPATPVIVVSGVGSVTDAVEAMRLGAADFIEKPVSRERLDHVIDKLLNPGRVGSESEAEAERVLEGARYGTV